MKHILSLCIFGYVAASTLLCTGSGGGGFAMPWMTQNVTTYFDVVLSGQSTVRHTYGGVNPPHVVTSPLNFCSRIDVGTGYVNPDSCQDGAANQACHSNLQFGDGNLIADATCPWCTGDGWITNECKIDTSGCPVMWNVWEGDFKNILKFNSGKTTPAPKTTDYVFYVSSAHEVGVAQDTTKVSAMISQASYVVRVESEGSNHTVPVTTSSWSVFPADDGRFHLEARFDCSKDNPVTALLPMSIPNIDVLGFSAHPATLKCDLNPHDRMTCVATWVSDIEVSAGEFVGQAHLYFNLGQQVGQVLYAGYNLRIFDPKKVNEKLSATALSGSLTEISTLTHHPGFSVLFDNPAVYVPYYPQVLATAGWKAKADGDAIVKRIRNDVTTVVDPSKYSWTLIDNPSSYAVDPAIVLHPYLLFLYTFGTQKMDFRSGDQLILIQSVELVPPNSNGINDETMTMVHQIHQRVDSVDENGIPRFTMTTPPNKMAGTTMFFLPGEYTPTVWIWGLVGGLTTTGICAGLVVVVSFVVCLVCCLQKRKRTMEKITYEPLETVTIVG